MEIITLEPGQHIQIEASMGGVNPGIPFAGEVRLPMETAETKEWYEATRRYGPYRLHPERCEDFNLETGGNTDLGEVLVAPFTGFVLAARNLGGRIGKVVQLLGIWDDAQYVWAGWHLQEISPLAMPGRIVEIGDRIGTVGNADGRYAGAHLHTQVCELDASGIPAPWAFASDDRYSWLQPSEWFIDMGVDAELVRVCCEWPASASADIAPDEIPF